VANHRPIQIDISCVAVKNDRTQARDPLGGGYIIGDRLPHLHGKLDTSYRASVKRFFEERFTKLFIRRKTHFPTPYTPRARGVIVGAEAAPLAPQTNSVTIARRRFALPCRVPLLNSVEVYHTLRAPSVVCATEVEKKWV
jgi:hypothetical protein